MAFLFSHLLKFFLKWDIGCWFHFIRVVASCSTCMYQVIGNVDSYLILMFAYSVRVLTPVLKKKIYYLYTLKYYKKKDTKKSWSYSIYPTIMAMFSPFLYPVRLTSSQSTFIPPSFAIVIGYLSTCPQDPALSEKEVSSYSCPTSLFRDAQSWRIQ